MRRLQRMIFIENARHIMDCMDHAEFFGQLFTFYFVVWVLYEKGNVSSSYVALVEQWPIVLQSDLDRSLCEDH